ncbi:MAG TPA: mannose-1-phosphate guanyltransferase, partial [Desulfobacterales bacterium]|nr:mannose-1-phosphate guanyltransferase [Desulfobacterales bacterium]
MIAVILSAGVGRRLAPLTENIPKALIEVGGRPLIWHTLVALR